MEPIDAHITQGDSLSTARCLTRFVVQQLGEGVTVAWSEVEGAADTDGDGRLSLREAQYSIQRLAPHFASEHGELGLRMLALDSRCLGEVSLECRGLVSSNCEMRPL